MLLSSSRKGEVGDIVDVTDEDIKYGAWESHSVTPRKYRHPPYTWTPRARPRSNPAREWGDTDTASTPEHGLTRTRSEQQRNPRTTQSVVRAVRGDDASFERFHSYQV